MLPTVHDAPLPSVRIMHMSYSLILSFTRIEFEPSIGSDELRNIYVLHSSRFATLKIGPIWRCEGDTWYATHGHEHHLYGRDATNKTRIDIKHQIRATHVTQQTEWHFLQSLWSFRLQSSWTASILALEIPSDRWQAIFNVPHPIRYPKNIHKYYLQRIWCERNMIVIHHSDRASQNFAKFGFFFSK